MNKKLPAELKIQKGSMQEVEEGSSDPGEI